MSTFPDVKKNFGFGCMRLPMDGEKVDYAEFTKMVDEFMAQGFNYFDTARVYIGGQGETAIRDCVVKRYPRDSFILTDKLSDSLFNSENEIRPLFEKQLESCGVDYFDFYLLHSQTKSIFEKYKKLHAYEHAFELKKEGKVKHVGFSFHDTADVLDEMLNEYPEIEVVQIQLNYIDFEDPAVQARLCYEVCRRHSRAGQGYIRRSSRRQPGELRDTLRSGFRRRIHGALRHERHGADERQPVIYEGL